MLFSERSLPSVSVMRMLKGEVGGAGDDPRGERGKRSLLNGVVRATVYSSNARSIIVGDRADNNFAFINRCTILVRSVKGKMMVEFCLKDNSKCKST